MDINIARVFYPVRTLGPGERVGIWFSGCPFSCDGCISPELRELTYGNKISIDSIMDLISRINKNVDGITISGGEPFFQPVGLNLLLKKLSHRFNDIIVFTGYDYKELIGCSDRYIKDSLEYISMIIDGRFVRDRITIDGLRGSANQNIIKLKDIYGDIDFYKIKKEMQMIFYDKNIIEIGIPGG